MHPCFSIFGYSIPSYGAIIVLGVIVSNALAYLYKRKTLNFDDLILIEAYALLGAILGGKLFYVLVNFENKMYNAPSNYDAYLTGLYGNYMKLPPVEKRISHEYKVYLKDEVK